MSARFDEPLERIAGALERIAGALERFADAPEKRAPERPALASFGHCKHCLHTRLDHCGAVVTGYCRVDGCNCNEFTG